MGKMLNTTEIREFYERFKKYRATTPLGDRLLHFDELVKQTPKIKAACLSSMELLLIGNDAPWRYADEAKRRAA